MRAKTNAPENTSTGHLASRNGDRVVFLDWLRVIACFIVMVIYSCEPFYLGGEVPNVTSIANKWDAIWISFVESVCCVCVPLFVMASSYLLFPLKKPTGEFFRRRLVRIVVPFPAEFKREDFWKQSMMRFEFCTDSGKPSGPYRTIKYKHGVKATFGE